MVLMKRFLGVLAAVALVLGLAPGRADALEVVYSYPVATGMNSIHDTEVLAITEAHPGATIDITNPFVSCAYAKPLRHAVARGVHVHLYTFASTIGRYRCGPQMVTLLGSTVGSSVRVCETSCYKEGFGQLHSKTMQITYLNGIRRVFIGSNDWAPGSRTREFNSLVVSSCGRINDGVHRWFKGMALRKPISYFPKRVRACGQTLHQFPYPRQTDTDNAWLDTLKHQRCRHEQIHVKASKIQSEMMPVVRRLIELRRKGCGVHLIVGTLTGRKVIKVLRRSGLDVRQSGDVNSAHPGIHSHMKEVLFSHPRCRHSKDLMGSANIGPYWNSENNLLLFPVTQRQCRASMRQWDEIWRLAHRL